jgi:HD-like signal output (HDOD) protein
MNAILVVDDEEAIARSLCRTLRRHDYQMHSAFSGAEALEVLRRENIDMVISDMRMPGMTGYDLLSIVKREYPRVLRVVLSGYADAETMVKTVADGVARTFLTKPCGNEELKTHIGHLFELHARLRERRLTEKITEIENLPGLPTLYNRLVECIQKNASMDEVAEVISHDPHFTAQILHIANSSFYAAHIGSIKFACVYLGLDTIKNLVLTTEIFRSFAVGEPERLAISRLWAHSALANKIFHFLYRKVHAGKVPDEYSCCGLLHDVGLLIMIRYFPQRYFEMEKTLHGGGEPGGRPRIEEVERAMGEAPHAALGAFLLDWWNLPYSLVETSMFHHTPADPAVINREICSLVHVADCLSWQIVDGLAEPAALDARAFEAIPADRAAIMAAFEEIRGEIGDGWKDEFTLA